MKNLLLASAGALTLAACQTLPSGVVNADAKLRDKCAYLRSGVTIAQIAVAFYPSAKTLVDNGKILIDTYCSGRPVTDVASALDAMESVIVAIRPVAAAAR